MELLEQGVTALDAATRAVAMFEDCELFNCGKGAVGGFCCVLLWVDKGKKKEGGKGGRGGGDGYGVLMWGFL